MAINLKRTTEASVSGVKLLVYGQAGAGKTRLVPTLPKPILLSAESGLLSLQGEDIPYITIGTMADLHEAYTWLTESEEAQQYESVALDSLSEIAEVVLSAEKRVAKDPRQAYGEMQDQMTSLIRAFRDLPGKHVYFSAKVEKTQDDMGRLLYAPSMPGNKTGQALPYFFDEVFCLRTSQAQGNVKGYRYLQTQPDFQYVAKDRSGVLDEVERPDLSHIFNKIQQG